MLKQSKELLLHSLHLVQCIHTYCEYHDADPEIGVMRLEAKQIQSNIEKILTQDTTDELA